MSGCRWDVLKLPNYIKRFGALHGARLFFKIERNLSRKSKAIERFNLPDYRAPVYLRKSISDHAIFFQCLVKEQYDFYGFHQSARLLTTYRESLEKGIRPLIIDCGGNIGLATVWLARQFPEASVFTVEPDEENFELLQMNTNSFSDRVTPLRGGIWQEKAELEIVNPDSGSAAFRLAAGSERAKNIIRAYTINEICALAGVSFPFIVKIDIEGAQSNLFTSNTAWVGDTHLIVIELDDWVMPWQGTSRAFFSCISQYPFDYLMSGESLFCFRDFEALS